MGRGLITMGVGVIFLLAITYTVNSASLVDFGSMEWFYKTMTTTVATLLALILVGLGNIISRMDK